MHHLKKLSAAVLLLAIATLLGAFALTTVTSIAIKSSTIDSTPIGATTPSTGVFTGLQANTNFVNGTAFKQFRTAGTSCTTDGTQGHVCNTSAISFPGTAWPDTNYTGVCATDGSNTGSPVIQGIGAKTTTTFTIAVMQGGTAASSYGTADCLFFHD